MPRGQSYWDAKARYQREKRKLISADVPKEIGERYRVFAAKLGESMSGLIRRAVDEFIARHVGTATEISAEPAAEMSAENVGQTCSASRADETCSATHEPAAEMSAGEFRRADETPPQPAETTEIGNVGEGIPTTFNGVDHTAQNQPVSKQVQTIEATCNAASKRITAADKHLVEAVNALSPESKKALLKFLSTLQA